MKSLYLATGLIVRSEKIEISQVNWGVKTLQDKINMIYWNKEGYKVGICKKAPTNQDYAILALCNSTGIKQVFWTMHSKFNELFKRKAYMHVYNKFKDDIEDLFNEASHNCLDVASEYEKLEWESKKTVSDEEID